VEIHGFRFTYVNNQVRYNLTLAGTCSSKEGDAGHQPTGAAD